MKKEKCNVLSFGKVRLSGSKILGAIAAASLALSLCACSGIGGDGSGVGDGVGTIDGIGTIDGTGTADGVGTIDGAGTTDGTGAGDGTAAGDGTGSAEASGRERESGAAGEAAAAAVQAGGIQLLTDLTANAACSTEEGYYYLTVEAIKLRDGEQGSRLMYMDYASAREIFLCSTAGCSHDSVDCPAVFPRDEFPAYSTQLFVWGGGLYILRGGYDSDQVTVSYFGSNGEEEPESRPAVLYRANLDGTERRKVYTFEAGLKLEGVVFGDDSGIYVITKKLAADAGGDTGFSDFTGKRLMRLNLKDGKLAEVCSLDFGDSVSRKIIGCYGDKLLFGSIDFGREVTSEELWDDDIHKELFDNSWEVCELLDIKTGKRKEVCRIPNRERHSLKVLGNRVYVSYAGTGEIKSIVPETGEEKTIARFPQSQIMEGFGNLLCCRDFDLADSTWYFVNTDTGEISHSTLVSLSGGSLEFKAVTGKDVLVINDYDTGDMYDFIQYHYALISLEDLMAGRPNWRRIEMIGSGQ